MSIINKLKLDLTHSSFFYDILVPRPQGATGKSEVKRHLIKEKAPPP